MVRSGEIGLKSTSAPPPIMQTASMRQLRGPRLATTQRRLAASKKWRAQGIEPTKKFHHRTQSIARRLTCPETTTSEDSAKNITRRDTCPSLITNDENYNPEGIKRCNTGSSFVISSEKGTESIEVEFTDDGDSVSDEMLVTSSAPKAVMKPSSKRKLNDARKLSTSRTRMSGYREYSKVRDSAEWELALVSSPESSRFGAGMNRDMLARLANMETQTAPESQFYMARSALKVQPADKKRSAIPNCKKSQLAKHAEFSLTENSLPCF